MCGKKYKTVAISSYNFFEVPNNNNNDQSGHKNMSYPGVQLQQSLDMAVISFYMTLIFIFT